jgi:subtilisin family serine protease
LLKGVSAMEGPIYRLPPMLLGPRVYMANELTDKLDWGLEINGIDKTWVTKGEGIKIGVADTGQPDHPDLVGAIVQAKNFSQSSTVRDLNGHSTHVCGTIGARENGKGVIGVAPRCSIVIAKVLNDDGSGNLDAVAKGIDWLVDQGCDIISLSLGGSYHPQVKGALDRAVARGVFIICAAGNEGYIGGRSTVGWPAASPKAVAVASYNKDGNLSDFSSRGPEVDIAFPGEDILSTWPGNGYRRISGTSMATPFCAGMVAELIAQQRKADEAGRPVTKRIKNNIELLDHLKAVAVDKGPAGFDGGWGWGVVDVKKFYAAAGVKPEEPEKTQEIDLGLLKIVYPAIYEGKQGWFVYIP